jgi:hypothetical protein
LLDIGATSAVYDLSKTAVTKFDLQIRSASHEAETLDLGQIFNMEAKVNASLARMLGQVSAICFEKLSE